MKLIALPALLLAVLAALTVIPLDKVQGGGYAPGETVVGQAGYVEYHVGDLPIILSLPHAGLLRPETIPDRTQAILDHDPYAGELGVELSAAIERRTGRPVHLILSQLHRSKLDANRSREDGAQGDPLAIQAWQEYHGFLLAAKQAVVGQCGRGLLLDLHTNGRDGYLIELGYGLTAEDLAEDDDHLDRESFMRRSTVRELATFGPTDHSELLRGFLSLGGLMAGQGYAAEPSPERPQPTGDPYFSGGYTIFRHGSLYGGWVDAVQVEVSLDLLRPAVRSNLIDALAGSVIAYVDSAYGFHLSGADGGLCPSFVDIPFDHPASDLIESLQSQDVLSACSMSPRRYCPSDAVTRAETAVMAVRLVGEPAVEGLVLPSFVDLSSDRWDAGALEAAAALGWLSACGRDPMRACPESPLTRAEAVHLAVALAPSLLSAVPSQMPADVTAQPGGVEGAAVLHAGWLAPCRTSPSLALCPEAAVTRLELAQLLAAVGSSWRTDSGG